MEVKCIFFVRFVGVFFFALAKVVLVGIYVVVALIGNIVIIASVVVVVGVGVVVIVIVVVVVGGAAVLSFLFRFTSHLYTAHHTLIRLILFSYHFHSSKKPMPCTVCRAIAIADDSEKAFLDGGLFSM